MPTCSNSYTASPIFRLELRPSRQLTAALLVIAVLAAAGLFLSDLPVLVAALAAPLCIGWGVVLARRSWRAAAIDVAFCRDGRVHVDGEAVEDVRLDWRGPLTCLEWRKDGRPLRYVAWPDVVSAPWRRELRLWRLAHRADASTRPVAP
jgi:hypothetical protein